MESPTKNFFIVFLSQMFCLKFLIVNQLFIVIIWAPIKILRHYGSIEIPREWYFLFWSLFFCIWFLSLLSDKITAVLVSLVHSSANIQYTKFCAKLLVSVLQAYPKCCTVFTKLYIIVFFSYGAHLLHIIDTPLIVDLYFGFYTIRTFFIFPVFSFFVIQNHSLYNDLKSRFHIMNPVGEALEKEVLSAVKKITDDPKIKGTLNKFLLGGAAAYLGSESYKQVRLSGIEAQKAQIAKLASQVDISDVSHETKASLLEEKVKAYNLEGQLRESSGFGAVFRDVRLASTGKPTLGQQHTAACNNQAELYFRTQLGLDLPKLGGSNRVEYSSVIERLFF